MIKVRHILLITLMLLASAFVFLPTEEAEAQDGAVVVVNAFRLNMRTGPGVQYAVVGELEGGDTYAVEAISPDRIWFKINGTPYGTGWVRGRYIVFRGDIEAVPVDSGPYGELASASFIVNINIPAFDEPNGDIIGTVLGGGRQYSVIGRSFDGGWVQLAAPNGVVWAQAASGAFRGVWFNLPVTYGGQGEIVFGPTSATAVVNAYGLNLRTGPGVEYRVIRVLEGGDTYDIVGISPDRIWFLIQTSTGEGWVRGRYIAFRGDINEVPIVEGPYGEIQSATFLIVVYVPVYDRPNGTLLGLLEPFEYPVTGRNFEGGWMQIDTGAYGEVWTQYSRGFFRGVYFDVPITFP